MRYDTTAMQRRTFLGGIGMALAAGRAAAQSPSQSNLYLIGSLAHKTVDKVWQVAGMKGHESLLIVRAEDIGSVPKEFKLLDEKHDKTRDLYKQLARIHPGMTTGFGHRYYYLCLDGYTCSVSGSRLPSQRAVRLADIASIAEEFAQGKYKSPDLKVGVNASFLLSLSDGWIGMPEVKTLSKGHDKTWVFRRGNLDYSGDSKLSDVHVWSRLGTTTLKLVKGNEDYKIEISGDSSAWFLAGAMSRGENPNVLEHGDRFFTLGGLTPEQLPRAQTVGLPKETAASIKLPCPREKADLIPPDSDFCYQAGV